MTIYSFARFASILYLTSLSPHHDVVGLGWSVSMYVAPQLILKLALSLPWTQQLPVPTYSPTTTLALL
jgi:hypothetical protein